MTLTDFKKKAAQISAEMTAMDREISRRIALLKAENGKEQDNPINDGIEVDRKAGCIRRW